MYFKYSPPKKLIVFDLDHTLISTNTSYCYLKTLYQRGALSISVLLRAALLKCRYYATSMTLEKLHYVVFDRMLRGFSLEALEKHIDDLLDKLLPGSLYLPAYQELTAAKERGDHTVLLSSSPDFLVRRFASYFGIDSWEGTAYSIDQERRLCKIAKLIVGTTKKGCLLRLQEKLGIPKQNVVVYTDSHDDIPLLLEAGEAVAVNPDRKLAKLAKLNKWRII
ncbi:MAG: HAD family phosphatase [Verrucomicrobia bacterium]|nr:HAD family phosphatase [Verrucomicrobiota bacterium]